MADITISDIDQAVLGDTVAKAFARTAGRQADQTALRWRDADGTWHEWTWADYADRAARVVTRGEMPVKCWRRGSELRPRRRQKGRFPRL